MKATEISSPAGVRLCGFLWSSVSICSRKCPPIIRTFLVFLAAVASVQVLMNTSLTKHLARTQETLSHSVVEKVDPQARRALEQPLDELRRESESAGKPARTTTKSLAGPENDRLLVKGHETQALKLAKEAETLTRAAEKESPRAAEDLQPAEKLPETAIETRLSERRDGDLVTNTSSKTYPFLEEPIVNPFPFHTILKPANVCAEKDIYIMAYVHTAPTHSDRRLLIRQTWAKPGTVPGINVKVLFALGAVPKEPSLQEALRFESEQYGDILQESYVDAYKNLTYKAMSALKYIARNCMHARFILKTDDDIFVNIFTLVNHLREMERTVTADEKWVKCIVYDGNMPVIREKFNKWYVSEDEFGGSRYPRYCSGCAFFMSTVSAPALWEASLRHPFFWVDDVFITGQAASKAGLVHKQFEKAYLLHFTRFAEKYENDTEAGQGFVFSHFIQQRDPVMQLWNRVADSNGRHFHRHPKVPPRTIR